MHTQMKVFPLLMNFTRQFVLPAESLQDILVSQLDSH